jgi:hypothetical protein
MVRHSILQARSKCPPKTTGLIHQATKQDVARDTYRAATSRQAQSTLLGTVLLVSTSVLLFGLAAVSYLLFYHNYLPDQVTTVPVHLQYGSVVLLPRARSW